METLRMHQTYYNSKIHKQQTDEQPHLHAKLQHCLTELSEMFQEKTLTEFNTISQAYIQFFMRNLASKSSLNTA
uniref:Uncharacterized protein n=1 Tax=Setaria italica TaxID=4555 RepID=K3ZLS3_SETIT